MAGSSVTGQHSSSVLTGAGSVSVGTTSTALSAAAGIAGYIQRTFQNDHATAKVWLGFGATAVASKGIRLDPGSVWVEDRFDGAVNAISDTAATTVLVTEV